MQNRSPEFVAAALRASVERGWMMLRGSTLVMTPLGKRAAQAIREGRNPDAVK